MNNNIQNTLTKAYSIIEGIGNTSSFEINCIQHMLISPSFISAFEDNDLYLKYIKNLVKESGNIAFPDKKSSYDNFFQDCITLKKQMQQRDIPFVEEDYLSYTVRLLENLKTPYYTVFSKTLFALNLCFSDRSIFEDTLNHFYSIIIKSSKQKLTYIRIIAENASAYKQAFPKNELLISGILGYQLAFFAGEKDFWLMDLLPTLYLMPATENDNQNTFFTEHISMDDIDIHALLLDYLNREKQFLAEIRKNADSRLHYDAPVSTEGMNLSCYLSALSLWFSEHKAKLPKEILYRDDSQVNLHGQIIDSSFLNTFAYNMTARTYVTNPAIEREQEIRDLELILISPKKSPILIGEAGVGKTSVVEGFSYLLQRNQVPDLLKNKKIFKLTTTSLLSGTKYVGEMEERIKKLMDELEKHPDVLLFIDEIHTIVGAGSTESSNNDISNMLKPYIDRGDIKIIGSTTSQEYVDYLLPDKALARRFYPITVEEPDEAMALRILAGTIPNIEYETKVKNPFSEDETKSILRILIQLSRRENQPRDRRTRLPELPLTLLEMAFSYAALDSRKYLAKEDIILSVRHTNLLKREIRMEAEQYF